MSEDWDPDEIFAILDDEYARTILTATSLEPMSARDLYETHDISQPTVSRRINTLLEHGFLEERTEIDPDGHHHSVYEARIDRVEATLSKGRFRVAVEFRDDPADRMTRIFQEMRGG